MNDTDKAHHMFLIDFPEPIPIEGDVIKEEVEGHFSDLGTAVVWIIISIYFRLKAIKNNHFLSQICTWTEDRIDCY